ncbi:GNAT family N-acetyltransferase [Pseudonocardia spinosispora]|uniref:GNAT family N-acetyltransferase n=1 Tax=Pseudonocardia spinosispora TaxID=103441 RepID=UPI0004265D25|nr:GNAT family N-acetyltransferase [Pseudonocardia spinosispora]
MRLTNVAHLRLPFGRLLGYDVTVGPPGRALPVSFDQRRHVGAGDRPGSWMALSVRLAEAVEPGHLAAAWLAVVARHGTLRSVFTRAGDGTPLLHEVDISPGGWVEHPVASGQAVNDTLRAVLDAACTPYASPSHRLCLLETADSPTVVVAADHAHVDMWSMLVVARDLLAALVDARAGRTPVLAETPPFAAHTSAMRDRPLAPDGVRARWAEVLAACGGVMPRFPLPLGEIDAMHHERVEVRDVLDVDASAALSVRAREEKVSALALVVSAMTAVTRERADIPLRAVFPVHSRYEATWHDSVGWFITNAVIESADASPRACAEAVKEAVHLGSWPLEDVLQPWGGMPEAPGMFAISWLDLRRLPVRVDATGLEAHYVGAAVLTDGVMLWFILDESGLHLRCRYPDTVEARRHVGGWLDALVARLRDQARAADHSVLQLAGRVYRIDRAARSDVPALIALLASDETGQDREVSDVERYEAAFDAISRDPSHFLAAVRDELDRVVGTIQLSIIPGLSRGGASRMQVEGLGIAPAEGAGSLGSAMIEWAHDYGRARGATHAQLITDTARTDARRFYESLGYVASHAGFTRPL